MVRLVDDLMDVARITRGTIELKRERVRLADVLRVAAETSEPLVTQFGHALRRGPVDDGIWLEGDFTRLTQIFSNLLNNACKYSEPGRMIDMSVSAEAGYVAVRIADQGIGIRPDMLERIFDMFTQVDDSLERAHGGLGVGLTLVRNLVEMHGGSVAAESAGAGKGSAFIVRLPVTSERVPEVSEDSEDGLGAGTLRVLIVEDNPALAQTAGWLVETMGHDYRLAHNGNDALAMAAEYRPDVVMLDIGLPGMNGYDVCRLMRQKPELQNTLFIAQTGWGQSEHLQMASDAGFHHHMVKPVDYDRLEKVLDGFVAGRGAAR
jgi:CheY-like chemotaxis protein